MSLAPYLFSLATALAVGLALGVAGMLLFAKNVIYSYDSYRMDLLEENQLNLSTFDGRWGVLQKVDTRLLMLGQPHESLRAAVDAAGLIVNG